MPAWRLQSGTLTLVLLCLLEVAGIGALIVGALCLMLLWSAPRASQVDHGEAATFFALAGFLLLAFGVPAFLVGFLARRWLTPRLHRDVDA